MHPTEPSPVMQGVDTLVVGGAARRDTVLTALLSQVNCRTPAAPDRRVPRRPAHTAAGDRPQDPRATRNAVGRAAPRPPPPAAAPAHTLMREKGREMRTPRWPPQPRRCCSSRSRSRSAMPPSRPPSATWASSRTCTTRLVIGWGWWGGRGEGRAFGRCCQS